MNSLPKATIMELKFLCFDGPSPSIFQARFGQVGNFKLAHAADMYMNLQLSRRFFMTNLAESGMQFP